MNITESYDDITLDSICSKINSYTALSDLTSREQFIMCNVIYTSMTDMIYVYELLVKNERYKQIDCLVQPNLEFTDYFEKRDRTVKGYKECTCNFVKECYGFSFYDLSLIQCCEKDFLLFSVGELKGGSSCYDKGFENLEEQEKPFVVDDIDDFIEMNDIKDVLNDIDRDFLKDLTFDEQYDTLKTKHLDITTEKKDRTYNLTFPLRDVFDNNDVSNFLKDVKMNNNGVKILFNSYRTYYGDVKTVCIPILPCECPSVQLIPSYFLLNAFKCYHCVSNVFYIKFKSSSEISGAIIVSIFANDNPSPLSFQTYKYCGDEVEIEVPIYSRYVNARMRILIEVPEFLGAFLVHNVLKLMVTDCEDNFRWSQFLRAPDFVFSKKFKKFKKKIKNTCGPFPVDVLYYDSLERNGFNVCRTEKGVRSYSQNSHLLKMRLSSYYIKYMSGKSCCVCFEHKNNYYTNGKVYQGKMRCGHVICDLCFFRSFRDNTFCCSICNRTTRYLFGIRDVQLWQYGNVCY